MNDGWLCDSILNAQAQPSPMSMIPAFSPGPCNTSLLRVGRRFRCTRDDLYEQCSLHITLKMPSSVRVGSRPPSSCLTFSNSSGVRPCSRTISGVMAVTLTAEVGIGNLHCRISTNFSHANSYQVCVERAPSPAAFDVAVDPDFDLISSSQLSELASVYTVADEVRHRRHRRTYRSRQNSASESPDRHRYRPPRR